jgi:hypothetical protein
VSASPDTPGEARLAELLASLSLVSLVGPFRRHQVGMVGER